jgi:hypothetical protein
MGARAGILPFTYAHQNFREALGRGKSGNYNELDPSKGSSLYQTPLLEVKEIVMGNTKDCDPLLCPLSARIGLDETGSRG